MGGIATPEEAAKFVPNERSVLDGPAPGPVQTAVDWVKGAPKRVIAAVKGNAAIPDLPEFRSIIGEGLDAGDGRYAQAGSAMALARSPEEQRRVIQKAFPEAVFAHDANGNDVVNIGGKFAYVNKPGFSGQDVGQGIAQTAIAAAPAILGGTVLGKVLGPTIGGAIGEGLGVGGASLAQDALFGATTGDKIKFNTQRAATDAGYGGAFGLAGRALSMPFRRNLPAIDRQNTARGLPSPVTLTTAQATRDPSALAFEAQARAGQAGDPARAALDNAGTAQQAALRGNIPAIQTQLSGQQPLAAGQGAADAQAALLAQRNAMHGDVNAVYDAARNSGRAYVGMGTVDALGQQLQRATRDFDVAGMPAAQRVLSQYTDAAAQFRQGGATGVSVDALERWRSRAVAARQDAQTTPATATAIGRMIDTYDASIDGAFRQALIRGDTATIDSWQNARQLRARFGAIFERDDIVNTLTARMRDGSQRMVVSPDEAVNYIFGRSNVGARAGLERDLNKLRDTLGADSPEWGNIRQEAFLRLLGENNAEAAANNAGRAAFPAAFAGRLAAAERDAPAVMRVLFGPDMPTLTQLAATASNVARSPATVGAGRLDQMLNSLGWLGPGAKGVVQRALKWPIEGVNSVKASTAAAGVIPRRIPGPFGLPVGAP